VGSARVSRVGFSVAPKQSFPTLTIVQRSRSRAKGGDREDAITSTRDACATLAEIKTQKVEIVLALGLFCARLRPRE